MSQSARRMNIRKFLLTHAVLVRGKWKWKKRPTVEQLAEACGLETSFLRKCSECNGSGRNIIEAKCDSCDGKGRLLPEEAKIQSEDKD